MSRRQQVARARELGITRIGLNLPIPMHECLHGLVEAGQTPTMTHFIIEAVAKQLVALGISPKQLQVPAEIDARRGRGGRLSATKRVLETLTSKPEEAS